MSDSYYYTVTGELKKSDEAPTQANLAEQGHQQQEAIASQAPKVTIDIVNDRQVINIEGPAVVEEETKHESVTGVSDNVIVTEGGASQSHTTVNHADFSGVDTQTDAQQQAAEEQALKAKLAEREQQDKEFAAKIDS